MKSKLLKYCVIPAGGLGTRWSPVTNYIPKVMIPLYDRPTIDWIVKEALDSGCTEIIIVIDRNKKLIKNHVSSNKSLAGRARLHFIYQKKIRGVAEVMYLAKKVVGDNYFSMIVSDHPCFYKTAPLREMVKKFADRKEIMSLVAFAKYPKYNNQPYGECLMEKNGDLYRLRHLCPKPKIPGRDHHPGNKLRIAGRYILNPKLFPLIKESLKSTKQGDLSDWGVFKLANKKNFVYMGIEIKSYFLDMGTLETYGQASKFILENKGRTHVI